jgi:transposase InsO family protein
MGAKSHDLDNTVAESFLTTLEKNQLHRTSFATRQEARTAVFDSIEASHNPARLHSTLDYQSPIDAGEPAGALPGAATALGAAAPAVRGSGRARGRRGR